ncbi:phosphatase PAP2 family protein [Neorhizobium sp. P12A]|nr:phosphatase PAP2 family protein [Neorhizobium sp. P12A]
MDAESSSIPTAKREKIPFRQALSRRYAVRSKLRRPIPWMVYALSAVNIVAIAFFILDAPLGQTAKTLPPHLITLANAVTDLGRLVWVLVMVSAVLAASVFAAARLSDGRRRFRLSYVERVAAYVAISVLSASIAVHILKYAIGRARPLVYDQYGIFSLHPFNGDFLFQSFPSAHSAHVGALFAALALLFPRLRALFIGLALWLAATRVIIGVHYPSDVIAGLALGFWFAYATAIVFSRFGLVFSLSLAGWPLPRLKHPGRIFRSPYRQDRESATTAATRPPETE